MSAVWVRLEEAERGGLPARCARSGDRCITRYRRPVSDLPAALEWTTWTGLWPHRRGRPVRSVVIPVLPGQQRLHETLCWIRDISAALLGVALVVLLLLAGGLPEEVARTIALGALAVHLLVAVIGWALTIEVRQDTSARWVRLSRVHPDFVAAVEATTERPVTPPILAEPAMTAFRRSADPGGSAPATDG